MMVRSVVGSKLPRNPPLWSAIPCQLTSSVHSILPSIAGGSLLHPQPVCAWSHGLMMIRTHIRAKIKPSQ